MLNKVEKEKESLTQNKCTNQEIEEYKSKLEQAQQLAEERLSALKYMQADFENYVKRFEKEKEQIIKLANEKLITELMVILDDFESSLRAVKDDNVKRGLKMVQDKFLNILKKHELKEIEAMGRLFDPNFHEVLYKEASEQEDDTIIEEIQKGYTLHSKVIRPSKVKVAKCNKCNQMHNQEKECAEIKQTKEKQ